MVFSLTCFGSINSVYAAGIELMNNMLNMLNTVLTVESFFLEINPYYNKHFHVKTYEPTNRIEYEYGS